MGWLPEAERRHGSTTSSHDTTGACDYFTGEGWRPERRGRRLRVPYCDAEPMTDSKPWHGSGVRKALEDIEDGK